MFGFIKKFIAPDNEEREILEAIKASGITSRRVVGRGTLTLDVREVTQSEKFKEYAEEAHKIVHQQAS